MLKKNNSTYCACGCGNTVKTPGCKFSPGHHRKGIHKKGAWIPCSYCGKVRWIFANDIKENNFCSRTCMYDFRRGKTLREKNPNWRGGKTIIAKRPAIYIPSHSRATREGYVYEHIVIAEKALGRSLKYFRHAHQNNEVVHHVDENKMNNANDNLLICESSYHKALHGRLRHAC